MGRRLGGWIGNGIFSLLKLFFFDLNYIASFSPNLGGLPMMNVPGGLREKTELLLLRPISLERLDNPEKYLSSPGLNVQWESSRGR
jgi:hypothetical protein